MIGQAELLREAASDLDPAVVEKVQAAITRDVAFFETASALQVLEGEEYWEAQRELLKQFNADEVEASPEAVEAARVLVDLLLAE